MAISFRQTPGSRLECRERKAMAIPESWMPWVIFPFQSL